MGDSLSIYQEVDLSLTENLIPVIVPVKQFDNRARRVRCHLYRNSVEYPVPEGVVMSCFGTRPDGKLFQYASDSTPELVFADSGTVILTLTGFMTEVHGRFPVDVSLLTDEGDVLGTFQLILKVERAAIGNGKVASLTYARCLETTIDNITSCFITEDGYFGIVSDNGLGIKSGSVSGTVDKVQQTLENTLLNSTITDDGYGQYASADNIGLDISVDEEGRLVVLFGADATNQP